MPYSISCGVLSHAEIVGAQFSTVHKFDLTMPEYIKNKMILGIDIENNLKHVLQD